MVRTLFPILLPKFLLSPVLRSTLFLTSLPEIEVIRDPSTSFLRLRRLTRRETSTASPQSPPNHFPGRFCCFSSRAIKSVHKGKSREIRIRDSAADSDGGPHLSGSGRRGRRAEASRRRPCPSRPERRGGRRIAVGSFRLRRRPSDLPHRTRLAHGTESRVRLSVLLIEIYFTSRQPFGSSC